MTKIHAIEKCIQCGMRVKPLIPSNYRDLIGVENMVDSFNKECVTKELENPCLFIISAHSVFSNASNIFYFLCPICCKRLIDDFLLYLIHIRKEIIFQSFNKIKGELKNGRYKNREILC